MHRNTELKFEELGIAAANEFWLLGPCVSDKVVERAHMTLRSVAIKRGAPEACVQVALHAFNRRVIELAVAAGLLRTKPHSRGTPHRNRHHREMQIGGNH